jgi:uncharacterized protein HemX
MSDETNKMADKGASNQVIVAVLLVIALSVATGLVVHHNDKTTATHDAMVSAAMQKTEVKKAATAAAMKQEETDKMAASEAMAKDETTNTTAATQ